MGKPAPALPAWRFPRASRRCCFSGRTGVRTARLRSTCSGSSKPSSRRRGWCDRADAEVRLRAREAKTPRRLRSRATSSWCGKRYYGGVMDAPAMVNEENFAIYGASTTPTLVAGGSQRHRAPVPSRSDFLAGPAQRDSRGAVGQVVNLRPIANRPSRLALGRTAGDKDRLPHEAPSPLPIDAPNKNGPDCSGP